MSPSASSDRVICAICYEEAKPASEDLQSISICGHVFHELCLQQWLEYCPRGRRPTCPLCKQHCSRDDAHRLFFQSAAELTQAKTPLCSELHTPEALKETIQKLEGQLSISKQALTAHQQHLMELQAQLSVYVGRLERAEATQAEAKRETAGCKEALSRVQEELRRSAADRSKLLEKNTSMAKDLATYKLLQELDLNKDEMLKIACVSQEANKDDVIDTLSRSLVIRNRTYKELMAKCNELGVGQSKAFRKCEKAFELIKRLKARVQELEKDLEKQENLALQSMKKACTSFSLKLADQINASNEARGSLDKIDCVDPFTVSQRGIETPPLGVSDPLTTGDQPAYSKLHQLASLAEEEKIFHNDVELQRREGHNPINVENKIEGKNFAEAMSVQENKCCYMLPSVDSNNGKAISPKSGLRSNIFLYDSAWDCAQKAECLFPPHVPQVGNSSNNVKGVSDTCLSIPDEVCLIEDSLESSSLPFPIKKEAGLIKGGITVSHFSDTIEILGDNSKAVTEGKQAASVGKWCKGSECKENRILQAGLSKTRASSGQFICYGANGRGGQVKVLKPPRPALEVVRNKFPSLQRQTKRYKGMQSGGQECALQIEHFFSSFAS